MSSVSISDADDAASDASARVPGSLAELMSCDAEIVGIGVYDQRATQDAVRAG